MRILRLFGVGGQWRSWVVLFAGMLLGSVITSTFTFRLWLTTNRDVLVDKETLNFVQVNENIRTNKRVRLRETLCNCPQDNSHIRAPVIDNSLRHSDNIPNKAKDVHSLQILAHNDNISSYLNPTKEPDRGSEGSTSYLSHEYQLKKKLLIAVITSEEHLKMADVVYDTWGSSAGQLIFFVGSECNVSLPIATGLPLVRLPNVHDTPVNSVEKVFDALKYISDNYMETFHWLMLATDNLFVRVSKLETLLMKLDPSSYVYLGRSANGRHGDMDKLSLLSHEHYCLGSTGVVLSAGLVKALTPHLQVCVSAAVNQAGSGGGRAVEWAWPDVELGRCVSRMTGTQCSQSQEAREYFVMDYSGHAPTLSIIDQSKKQFTDLITYHPINEPSTMRLLHYHYTRHDFKATLERAHNDESLSNEACNDLSRVPTSDVSPDDCMASLCPCEHDGRVGGKCPAMGVVNEPPKAYQPMSIYDYLPWQYFNDRTVFNDKLIHPSFNLQRQRDSRKELQLMLSKVVQAASDRNGRHLKFKRVVNGWVRHNPFRGNEYIVDCLFVDGFQRVIPKRVSLVRPLASNYVTLRDNSDIQTTVHFIVPLANVNQRFVEFMSMYEDIAFKTNEKVHLVLAVYGKKDIKFVKDVLAPYEQKYPQALVTISEGSGDFSRGKALHLGMSQLHAEDLAFICDVDMAISEGFVDRCRKNTIRGKRVYYPEFFKLYNLDYVYRNGAKYPNKISMKRPHGHWAYYSFGMLCIYKSDYTMVGGMNTNIKGWGEEDVKFFEKVIRKKLDVLRAPDPALSHRWHEKTCPKNLSSTQYKHCLSSRGENLADRIELANYIYELDVQLKYKSQGQAHSAQLSLITNDTTTDDYSLDDI